MCFNLGNDATSIDNDLKKTKRGQTTYTLKNSNKGQIFQRKRATASS